MRPAAAAGLLLAAAAAAAVNLLECWCEIEYPTRYKSRYICFGLSLITWTPKWARTCSSHATLEAINQTATVFTRLLGRSKEAWELPASLGECPQTMTRRDLHLCEVQDDYIRSFAEERVVTLEWDEQNLKTGSERRRRLGQAQRGIVRAERALTSNFVCRKEREERLTLRQDNGLLNKSEAGRQILQIHSEYWRHRAQFVSRGVRSIRDAILAFAFEEMGERVPEERLNKWIRAMKKLNDLLHLPFNGWVEDAIILSEQILNARIEEDEESPGHLLIRVPLVRLQEEQYLWALQWPDDITQQCKHQLPEMGEMVEMGATTYSSVTDLWISRDFDLSEASYKVINEGWQLEDQSNNTVVVDTRCVQLLVDLVDDTPCPLVDTSDETIRQQQHCRLQLRNNLLHRRPYIPVTSYLAYTQRVSINLCLLSWMIYTSQSLCQDVAFSFYKSINESRCFFSESYDNSCPERNTTETICSVARAIFLLKCENFIQNDSDACTFDLNRGRPIHGFMGKTSQKNTTIFLHRSMINNATLRYKDFKIDFLLPLEISFAVVNLAFRFLSVGVYIYLPHLRNLPGKLFLCYQLTSLAQIFSTEVLYRMAGVPDIATAVQVDSSLTFLGLVWLNLFCYQMYKSVHELRLPDDLAPDEVKTALRNNVLGALIAWIAVLSVVVTLENVSERYLFHSRVFLLNAICASVAVNLVLFGAIGYMWRRTRSSMDRLKISSGTKFGSMKETIFMSLKTIILSGVGVIVRLGFQQAQGIAQAVYYVHMVTMLQGPLLFVLFVCSDNVLPVLRVRFLKWWDPDVIWPGQELCSAAEKNLARRQRREQPEDAETQV